jgi:hypothetical protein
VKTIFMKFPLSKRNGPIAVVAAVVLVILIAAYAVHLRKDMSDFGVCYQAGGRIRAGETLYRASDGHLQFKYAPLAAILYTPFSLLPRQTANAAWFAVDLMLLLVCFILAFLALPPPRRPGASVLGLAVLVLGKFIGREFELGQVNLLILGLIMSAFIAFQKRNEGSAGLFWALSLFFKPYALVFLPYFLLKKRFRLLAAGAAAVAVGLAIPAAFYGWNANWRVLGEWAGTLSQSTPILLEVGDNASLYAFLAKHLGTGTFTTGFFLALAVLLAASVLWLMARSRRGTASHPEALDFAYLLVLIPLLSPLGWYYNYLYGLAAVVLILNGFKRMSPGWRYAAGANFLVIGGTLREVLGKTIFRFYTHHSLVALNFLVVLLVLAYLRKRDIA